MDQSDAAIIEVFSAVAPRIDILSTAFSFGLSKRWRRKAMEHSSIGKGDRVLDICTGTGEMAFEAARRVGREGEVTGVDFCAEMIELARAKARGGKHPDAAGISFIRCNAKRLVFPDESFDAVTVAFGMRNIPDTAMALNEARRTLRKDGKFLCLELTRPEGRSLLPFYKFYIFRVMPFVGRFAVRTDVPYSYLPRSIYGFYSAGEFRTLIEECGFSDVSMCQMTMGVATAYEARKR